MSEYQPLLNLEEDKAFEIGLAREEKHELMD